MSGFILVVVLLLVLFLGGIVLVFSADTSSKSETENSNPTSRSLEDLEDVQKIIELAEQHESNHQWARAIEAWTKLTELEPDRTDAYFRRALVAYRTQDYQQAHQDFERVIERQDDPPPEIFLHTARSLMQLNQPQQAFPYYTEYYEKGNPGPKVIKEIADLGRSLEKWSQARQYYEELTEVKDSKLATDARLCLVEIALNRDFLDKAADNMNALDTKHEQNSMTDEQELHYWYLKAKLLDSKEKPEKADRFYRKIYQRNPSYRDVKEIIEQQISNLDADSLVRKFQGMDQNSYEDLCRRIVEGMDYEVVETNFVNPEELDILAREKSVSLRVTRVLFAFKQWRETAGELAIKEFEFKLVENRYDQGYFVNPAGYKSAAQNYARGNDKIRLMGAEQLLSYLEEWYQKEPENT